MRYPLVSKHPMRPLRASARIISTALKPRSTFPFRPDDSLSSCFRMQSPRRTPSGKAKMPVVLVMVKKKKRLAVNNGTRAHFFLLDLRISSWVSVSGEQQRTLKYIMPVSNPIGMPGVTYPTKVSYLYVCFFLFSANERSRGGRNAGLDQERGLLVSEKFDLNRFLERSCIYMIAAMSCKSRPRQPRCRTQRLSYLAYGTASPGSVRPSAACLSTSASDGPRASW